jgi:hypothetical protein
LLVSHLAVHIRGAVVATVCDRWTRGVLAARGEWTEDFDGEQFCLGRAFYTHLETGRTKAYFADAAYSNARVEEHAPGLQATLRGILAEAVRGRVVPRPDWCGAGVHVFPPAGPVAKKGGVLHFDTEGLADRHLAHRRGALSLVAMIHPPIRGGGLRLWPLVYSGADEADEATARAVGDVLVTLDAGDVVLFDSYRLHQIQPFVGRRERISATLHAAELHHGLWESWF